MNNSDALYANDNFQLRLSVFYSAIFFSIGCYLPYFPLWLQGRGLEAQDVAFILAAPMIVRVVFAPVISVWADYEGNYRKILIILGFGSLLALVLFIRAEGFYMLLVIAGLNAIFWSAIIPLTETLAMSATRQQKLNYGRARSWGSFSFIIASFGAGVLIDRYASEVVLWLLIGAGVLIFVSALLLPRPIGKGRLRKAVAKGRFSGPAFRVLLKNRLFWLFLVAAGLAQASHAFYYGFSSLHWASLGMSGWLIGSLWALGVIAEILLFVIAGSNFRGVNPLWLIGLGALAGLVRWGVSALDPLTLWIWVPLQVLHAFSFGMVHLGGMYFITDAIDETLGATAQGLHATVTSGVLMGGLVMISGPLYETVQVMGYLVMLVCCLLSLFLICLLYFFWDGKPLTLESAPSPKALGRAG